MRWEYRVVPVRWDNKRGDWVGMVQQDPLGNGVLDLLGWETVLAHYGAFGWELVSVLASGMLYGSGLREALVFFKRPLGGVVE